MPIRLGVFVDGKELARRFTYVATAMVILSAIWTIYQFADVELARRFIVGEAWWERLGEMRRGGLGRALLIAMGSAVVLVPCALAYYLLSIAEDDDSAYWWRLEEEAKKRATELALGADTLAVVLCALALENERDGRRPETIRRMLDAIAPTAGPDDWPQLREIAQYAHQSQLVADRVVRQASRPDLALVQFGGREYTALELSGHFNVIKTIVARLLGAPEDVVDKTTLTPAPRRRQ